MHKKRILVAPLNWGLGHATRCIPVINELINQGFEPVLASDGDALKLLQKEFPHLEHHELPGYIIKYSNKRSFFKLKLLLQVPRIISTIRRENLVTQELIRKHNISGIISDNRWGVRSSKIPSVFITHQLNVLSGTSTFLSSRLQQVYIKKHTECWVPDHEKEPNLSGEMGHLNKSLIPVKYIGFLSRFSKTQAAVKYKFTAILSGPEPQRGLLEAILLKEFKNYPYPVLLIQGVVHGESNSTTNGNLTIINYLLGKELETAINSSEFIICRSGYTSIMDLAYLGKKAFLIPTPGQPEQEYLAKRLSKNGQAATCDQHQFTLQQLDKLEEVSNLGVDQTFSRFSEPFALFQGE